MVDKTYRIPERYLVKGRTFILLAPIEGCSLETGTIVGLDSIEADYSHNFYEFTSIDAEERIEFLYACELIPYMEN